MKPRTKNRQMTISIDGIDVTFQAEILYTPYAETSADSSSPGCEAYAEIHEVKVETDMRRIDITDLFYASEKWYNEVEQELLRGVPTKEELKEERDVERFECMREEGKI